MRSPQFKGTGVAVITPLHQGKVDYNALRNVINHLIDSGIDYIVSLGSTGEAVTLTKQECRKVLDFTIETIDGRCPLVAGMFGGNSTYHLLDRIKEFNFDGCDAILSSNPGYVKPTQEGIYQHYMKVADTSPLPIIIYNVPGRTSSNMLPETVARLANDHSQFVAVKEASGDLVQGTQMIKACPDDFLILSGDDPTALGLIAAGGNGVISVIANAYPVLFSQMINAAINKDMDTAQRINEQLFDLHHWLYVEGNPAGIKAAMHILDFCSNELRLPLVPMTIKNYNELKKEMEKVRRKVNVGL